MRSNISTIVVKFGGTSVGSRDSILTIVKIVKSLRGKNPVVVVSAVRGVTETLLSLYRSRGTKKEIEASVAKIREMHERLIEELLSGESKREVLEYLERNLRELAAFAESSDKSAASSDKIVSFGEIISSFLVSRVLRTHGIKSDQVLATKMIITDKNFGQAEFLPKETSRNVNAVLPKFVAGGIVPVVTGFIGKTKDGRTATLGRGGSDYSASIIGYALKSKEIQIWTDVDGIYTSDPRVVKNAKLLPQVSYREASEMAAFGAKVLHPRTIRPAIEKNIPVRILNTFHPEARGTLVSPRPIKKGLKVIAFKRKVTLITIYSAAMLFSRGFLARVFEIFAEQNISVDLVSVSEVSVSVTLDNNENLGRALSELEKISRITVHRDGFGVISLIGEEVVSARNLLNDVSALFNNKIPIRMISMGASDINISLVLPAEKVVRAVQLIHNKILLKK